METKTYVVMQYSELQNMVMKQYPNSKEYSFVAVEEANNDSVYEFNGINKKEYDTEFDRDDDDIDEMFNSFKGLNFFPMYKNRMLLLHLCSLDLIPEGDYLIEVWY